MSQAQNLIFPIILDTLSHKPQLCETQSTLLKDLSQILKSRGINVPNLKKALETAVDLGKGLGILSVQDEEVRMPFLLNDSRGATWPRSTRYSSQNQSSHSYKSRLATKRTHNKKKTLTFKIPKRKYA